MIGLLNLIQQLQVPQNSHTNAGGCLLVFGIPNNHIFQISDEVLRKDTNSFHNAKKLQTTKLQTTKYAKKILHFERR